MADVAAPGEYRGLRLIGHGGAWKGYRAYLGRFPEHGLGIVVLSNHAAVEAQDMAMTVTLRMTMLVGSGATRGRPTDAERS
jgi:hypothetical protein